MKCIDFEAHYYPEEFMAEAARRKEPPYFDEASGTLYFTGKDGREPFEAIGGPGGKEYYDLDGYRIQEMDRAGTDMQVLSPSQGIEMLPPETGIPIAQAANRKVYAAMQKYPGRFQGMAALPLTDVDASLRELEVCAKDYGFIGLNLFSYLGNGNYPDDEKYEPLFALADKLGLFVYLHPAHAEIARLHGAGPQMLSAVLGFGLDTLITFARMLARGLFDRYPDLKILMGHFGEAIPFIYDRFHNHSRGDANDDIIRAPAINKYQFGHYVDHNLYVTSSGMTSVSAFSLTKDVLGIDKILFGSDYPMDRPHSRTRAYIESLPLSKTDREKILSGNAIRLFGLDV